MAMRASRHRLRRAIATVALLLGLAAAIVLILRANNLAEAANLAQLIAVPLAFVPLAIQLLASARSGRDRAPENAVDNPSPIQSGSLSVSEFLYDLIRSASALSYGDPAATADGEGRTGELTVLEQVWISLRVADSRAHPGVDVAHGLASSESAGQDLNVLLEETTDSVLVLGEPGSGKSTSLAFLAINAGRKRLANPDEPLPVRVRMGDIVARTSDPADTLLSGVPEIYLMANRDGLESANRLRMVIRREILEGRALLLLDGLDEIKEHQLVDCRRAIVDILLLQNGTRVVATCRKFDYRQQKPSRKIPVQREVELLPYNRKDKNRYVQKWYEAATNAGRFTATEAAELSAALKLELLNPELSELAQSPLLLTLLTLIHSEEGKLPDTRAVVCDRAIRYMITDSPLWRKRKAEDPIAVAPLRALAEQVAHHMHLNEEAAQESAVTFDAIRHHADHVLLELGEERRTSALGSDRLSRQLLASNGLMQETSPGRYKFAHRYFQEFLASRQYAQGARPEEALAKSPLPHWREPFRLMAGFAGHEGENIFYVLTLVSELLDPPVADQAAESEDRPVASVQVAAEMLVEIGRDRLVQRGFGHVLDGTGSSLHGLWNRARAAVACQVEAPGLTVADRYRAAVVIGHLDDPRFLSEDGRQRGPWETIVDIPAGPARLGTERLDTAATLGAGTRKMEFGGFGIGRYLITNAQFAEFIADGGYRTPAYWDGVCARGWLAGDRKLLERLADHWLTTVFDHHAK